MQTGLSVSIAGRSPVSKLPRLSAITPASIAYNGTQIVITPPTFPGGVGNSLTVTYEAFREGVSIGYVPTTFTPTGLPATFRVQARATATGYKPYSGTTSNLTVLANVGYPYLSSSQWEAGEEPADSLTRRVYARTAFPPPVSGKVWAVARGSNNPTALDYVGKNIADWNYTFVAMTYDSGLEAYDWHSAGTFAKGQTDAAMRLALVNPAAPNDSSKEWATDILVLPTISGDPVAPGVGDWSVTQVAGGYTINLINLVNFNGRAGIITVETTDTVTTAVTSAALPNGNTTGNRFVANTSANLQSLRLIVSNANGSAASTAKTVTPGAAAPTETVITVGEEQFTFSGAVSYAIHPGDVVEIVGPATLTARKFTPAGSGTTLRNGHRKNPAYGSQAFDGRCGNRDATAPDALPITFAVGDTFVAAASMPDTMTSPRQGPVKAYYPFFFTSALQDAAAQAPAIFKWPGRTGALTVLPVVDYLAIAATLPTTFGVGSFAYEPLETVRYNLRFNPGRAITNSNAAGAGYEDKFPNKWAGSTSNSDANYGRWQGGRLGDYFMYLAAPLDQVSLATKAVILEAMDRYRIQSKTVMDAVGATLQGDGAHGQFDCGMWFLSYWLRGETSLLDTGLVGNWKEQYFLYTQAMLDTWFTPWGNENDPSQIKNTTVPATDGPPNTSYRRKIFAVDTVNNTITIPVWKGGTSSSQGDGGKARYDGMYLRRISDNAQTWVTGWQGGDITVNNAVSYKVLNVRNATGFNVNDVVFLYPGFTPTLGQPAWRLNSDATSNLHIPSAGAEYQQLQRDWGMKMMLRILGQYRDSWQPMWDYGVYANKTGLPASTPEVVDYPKLYESGSLAEAAWTQYENTIQAIPQPLQTPPATAIYPSVPAVDIFAAGGSTQFQQGDTDTQLLQPRTNLTVLSSNGGTAWSWAFIYRKPLDKRVLDTNESLFRGGDTSTQTSAFFFSHRQRLVSGNPNQIEYRHRGPSNSVVSGIYCPAWTEDAGLFVMTADGAGNFQFDWYSVTDGAGTRYAGTPVASNQNAITTIALSSLTMQFGGEMEMIAQVRGTVSTATWQSIAQGADFGTTIGAANVHWVREFNGTAASLTKPGWASADTTSPMTLSSIGGSGTPAQLPGSHITRPAGAGLTFDLYSGGWVHGLIKGQTTKFVTMSGKAWGGASGVVQMKVWQAENGRVVRDWVTIATISGGTWSGTIELPKGEDMFHRAIRLGSNPSVEYHDRNSFGVGWRIMVIGQSELNEMFGSADPSTLSRPNRTSYLTNQDGGINARLDMRRLGGERSGQQSYGAIAMANQIRQFDPEVPVQIVREVIVGTGMDQLIANSSARPWDLAGDTSNNGSLGDKLTKYGNDISAVVHMWASNERNIGFQPFKDRLSALVFGTGPDATGRFLNNVLQTGYRFVLVPHTRTAGGHNVVRRASIEWAYDNAASNVDIGVLPNDTSNSNTVNSHQDAEGGKMLARQLAISAGKALGLSNWTQPYFTGSTMNAARNQITITVARPNGGNLFSPAIALGIDLSGFYVSDGGTSTYRYQNGLYVNTGGSNGKTVRTGADTFKLPAVGGFTARIVDNDVVLTKTSGSWSAGTKWYHEAQGQYGRSWDNSLPGTGDDIDTVGNREVVDGALYESWAPDILNRGLTVGGRIISSRWNIENVENIDGQIFDTWTPVDTAPPLTATAVPTQSRSGNTITVTAPTWNVTPDTVTAIKNIDGAETSFGGGNYTLAPGSTGYVRYTAVKAGYSNGQTTSTTITNPAAAAPTIRSEAGSVASSDVTTWTATLPAGIVTGDTLYAWVTVDGNNTAVTQTATQPWTVLQDTAVGTSFKFLHLKKVATGTDTLSFSVAAGERFAAKIICINGAVATEAIGALTSGRDATGIDMITPNDTLVISAVIADGPSTNFADTNQPAGYTFLGTAARSQAATTGTVVALATLTAVQQTFDPGAWSGPNPTNSRSIVMGLR